MEHNDRNQAKISGFPFPSGFRDFEKTNQTEQTVNRKKSGFRTPHLKWEITGIEGIHAIPIIFMCILQGTFCDTGIPCTFYGGNVCSAASRHSVVDASSNSKFLSLVSSGYNTSKSPGLIHRVKIFFSVFKKMQFHHFQVINSIRHETCSIRHKKGIEEKTLIFRT